MPLPIKIVLSIVAVIVAALAYYVQGSLGHTWPKYAIALLAVLMLIGMWMFPEVKRETSGSNR